MYTMDDWKRDRRFSAKEHSEISEDVYYEFYNCLPPLKLPTTFKRTYEGGFQISEPNSMTKGQFTYSTFARKGDKYYYLGHYTKSGIKEQPLPEYV